MSRLLIHDYPLMVSPRLAVVIGLNEAIVLQQLHYWLGTSGKEREGRRWIYNTQVEWQAQFPFWSLNTVRRALESLEGRHLIETTDRYNVIKTDRTKWYTVNYGAVEALELPSAQDGNRVTQFGNRGTQNGQLLGGTQNGQLLPERETTSETSNKTHVISPNGEAREDGQALQPDSPTPALSPELRKKTGKAGSVDNATAFENVPPGAAALLSLWNEHCGPLPSVKVLTPPRVKALERLGQTFREEAADLFADAVREVARDPFWKERRYGLDNLLRDKVPAKAEAWRARKDRTDASPLARRRYD